MMRHKCKICEFEYDKMYGEFLGIFFICDTCLDTLFQIVREKRGV
jgi:hypothetical protein